MTPTEWNGCFAYFVMEVTVRKYIRYIHYNYVQLYMIIGHIHYDGLAHM